MKANTRENRAADSQDKSDFLVGGAMADSRGRSKWLALTLSGAVAALLCGGFVWRAAGYAGGEREADQAKIEGVLREQQTAWNRGDVEAFLQGYWRSPDLTFSGSAGITRGWDGVRERYKKRYADRAAMGQLEFSGLEFRFLGPDAALVLGQWHLKRETGDIGGVFSLVWQRFPEGWKIVHDHTSQAPAS